MLSRLRFTRAYHTTAKRYVRHLNARPPCIFDVVQSGSMAKAAAQLRVKQPSVSDRSPQGIRPTIYGDAFIECGVAVFEHWLVTVLWISLSQGAREGQPCRLPDRRGGLLSKQWALSPPPR